MYFGKVVLWKSPFIVSVCRFGYRKWQQQQEQQQSPTNLSLNSFNVLLNVVFTDELFILFASQFLTSSSATTMAVHLSSICTQVHPKVTYQILILPYNAHTHTQSPCPCARRYISELAYFTIYILTMDEFLTPRPFK